MIEFTIEELLIAEKPLGIIAQAKLPISISYQMSKIAKAVGEELKVIRESQLKIAQKYGEHDEAGELVEREGMYPILPEHMDKFNKEMEELLSETCTLNVNPLSVAKLDGHINLTTNEFMSLGKFLVD